MKKRKTEKKCSLRNKANDLKTYLLFTALFLTIFAFLLSCILFAVENRNHANAFPSLWHAFFWVFLRTFSASNGVYDYVPLTNVGKLITIIIAILNLAVIVIPTGVFSSYLYDKMVNMRRTKHLHNISNKIIESFIRTFYRSGSGIVRYVPWYKSVPSLQVKKHLKFDDIIDAVDKCENLRLANLSSCCPFEDNPNDRLVVEYFLKNRDYGYCLNQHSNVTIVVPSVQRGLSRFGYYMALFGGFNFISREVESDDDNVSFYNVSKESLNNPLYRQFKGDIEKMLKMSTDNPWVIVLSSAPSRDGKIIYFIHSTNNQGNTSTQVVDSLVSNADQAYNSAFLNAQSKLGQNVQVICQPTKYPLLNSDDKRNILYELRKVNQKINGFVIRPSYSISVWDEKKIEYIKDIAEALKATLSPSSTYPFPSIIYKSGIGFDGYPGEC